MKQELENLLTNKEQKGVIPSFLKWVIMLHHQRILKQGKQKIVGIGYLKEKDLAEGINCHDNLLNNCKFCRIVHYIWSQKQRPNLLLLGPQTKRNDWLFIHLNIISEKREAALVSPQTCWQNGVRREDRYSDCFTTGTSSIPISMPIACWKCSLA